MYLKMVKEKTDKVETVEESNTEEAKTCDTPVGEIPLEDCKEVSEEEEEVAEKPGKKKVKVKPIEVGKFKNVSDKGIKIKLIDGKKFRWITAKPGEIVTIPKKIALRNQLVEVK